VEGAADRVGAELTRATKVMMAPVEIQNQDTNRSVDLNELIFRTSRDPSCEACEAACTAIL
jgi:hypothetical protein